MDDRFGIHTGLKRTHLSGISALMGSADPFLRINSASRSVALALFLIMASFVLVKTGRDALYVQERGIVDLPIAYLGMAAFSLPVALGMLWLIRAAGPRRARVVALAGVTGVLVVFWQIAEPGGGAWMTALFAAVPLLYGVLFAATWLLAAELFDGLPEERVSRAYAQVGAGSIAGGLMGGAAARVLAPAVAPEAFFGIGALVLGASAVVVALTQANHAPRPVEGEAIERPRLASARSFLRRRYGALLLSLGVLGAIVGVLIEFQFYWAASTSGAGAREQSRYFANLYLVVNAAALTVQLLVMPRVQRLLGIVGSLTVMPAMLLGGAVLVAFSAGLAALGALRVTEGGLKASIHRANWEQAFLPAGSERDVAKLVVDGMGAHLGAGLIAAPLYLWLHAVVGNDPLSEHSGAWMAWLLIVSTAVFVVTTRLLKPWLRGSHAPGDRHEVSSLPPGGCVTTATLGQIVQKEECRRRYGESRRDARGSIESTGRIR
ncbi:MAG: hypothetical protein IH885_09125 [Myxococcales bacterium]|nr:hypothetical protein [Myxococcales bacterium]